MSATWKTVYEGEHEGRSVTIKESNDHTFKVLTKQNFHDEGIAYQEGDRYVHVSPASVGEQVESEVNSRDSLEEALKELHFSSESVKAILGKMH
ncbi:MULTISPECIES: hypothetical protein [Rhodanobacteraceae]|jgi:thiol:disulfide interchange protein|uniref:hypothetical protein n=1 Tax=Rhodanobacteraceae TaxID=1775411 RepID=UPI00056900A7|nr:MULTISPECIES: hypothetical protein [Rhodanobacteraceae]MDR6644735.1 thiol:disulfide interchange protein [Luteibacter sp. 1214]SDF36762.1 hypothetical protein SAMN04515659_0779 [Dyella sp. 333MFSha]SKC04738.1 hypothetical protein SAMN05660880_03949 [Luteibacter sp. 22Crub2.1]